METSLYAVKPGETKQEGRRKDKGLKFSLLGPAVISRRRTWLPPWSLLSQLRCRLVNITHVLKRHRAIPSSHSRAVREEMADLNFLFSVGGELWPELGDAIAQGHEPAVDELEHGQRADDLGIGPNVYDRVFLPGLRACSIGIPAPEIDNVSPTHVDRQRRTVLFSGKYVP